MWIKAKLSLPNQLDNLDHGLRPWTRFKNQKSKIKDQKPRNKHQVTVLAGHNNTRKPT